MALGSSSAVHKSTSRTHIRRAQRLARRAVQIAGGGECHFALVLLGNAQQELGAARASKKAVKSMSAADKRGFTRGLRATQQAVLKAHNAVYRGCLLPK